MEPTVVEALAKAQEEYLGEIIGKYLEAAASLKIARVTIAQYEQSLSEYKAQKEQVREAQAQLKAMSTNKDAFEDQNADLLAALSAIKGEVAGLKTALQMERENGLVWKEKFEATRPRKRGRPSKK